MLQRRRLLPGRHLRAAAMLAGLLAALVPASPASAQEADGGWVLPRRELPQPVERLLAARAEQVPDDAVLEAEGAVIGEIAIEALNVFDRDDPSEDAFLFRTANALHVRTRDRVVERKLLFAPGEPYSRRVLEETERHLRALDYLYDAWIEPVRYHDGRVDIVVVTRDVWTLGLSGGFQRSGGENTTQVEVTDANFLGTGRFLTAKWEEEPLRTSHRVRYQDTALFGSRAELRLLWSDNSDGHRRTLDLERPFYALDTRWGAGLRVVSDDRAARLYRNGDIFLILRQEEETVEAWAGWSAGYHNGRAHRWRLGYTSTEHGFSRHPLDTSGPRFPRTVDRNLAYPWIGFQRVADRWVELHDLDRIGRTEDVNLASELDLRLGWSAESLGAYRDQAVLDARFRTASQPGERQLLFFDAWGLGRWDGDLHENVQVGLAGRWFRRNFGRHQFHVKAEAAAGWNLDPEVQFLLGGDSGLRGYPSRYQTGDRRWLVSLEQRFYTDRELFKLVHVGAAVFFDVGHAWTEDSRVLLRDLGVLRDVGVGLRLGSSRSSQGTMIHLDVAWPLDGDDDGVQWLVTSRESF